MMDTAKNPARAVFYPRRIDLSIISPSSPSVAILYDGLHVADMSVAQSVSNIRSFLHSSSRIAAARDLRGEEAQGLIDLID